MHFSKTYAQILQDLPPELRENAIQYRQLKKLINQVVSELSSLGLSPTVLQELIVPDAAPDSPPATDKEGERQEDFQDDGGHSPEHSLPAGDSTARRDGAAPLRLEDLDPRVLNQARVKYEVIEHSDRIEPHLRLWVTLPDVPSTERGSLTEVEGEEGEWEEHREASSSPDTSTLDSRKNVLWSLHSKLAESATISDLSSHSDTPIPNGRTYELIVPLVSDTEFFNNLSTALESMSGHLSVVHADFLKSLNELSRNISRTALPASASPSFSPHSALTSHAGSIQVSSSQPSKSDLYSWREIFQLYVESEVFEHIGEVNRGERSLEECEKRLKLFVEQATQRGLADRRNFKLKQSKEALQRFIDLNLFILDIKKFSEASSEATRKILKKHTKRTALPLPSPFSPPSNVNNAFALPSSPLLLFSRLSTASLPRMFVQAIGETLLPIIPHIDDYSCLICTAIAFKPIRLSCGHLFCVRCLVKMQKRNKGDCPMCRAHVVLSANGSNVDWALLNFMQDWFPIEARAKLKANEKEATEEELRELGIDPNKACTIM